jgi:type VI protein secretion system component VasF
MLGLRAQRCLQLVPLMQLVQLLHALLQRDRNQQPHRDRPQVDPEVLPGMDRFVRRVYFDHRRLLVLLVFALFYVPVRTSLRNLHRRVPHNLP